MVNILSIFAIIATSSLVSAVPDQNAELNALRSSAYDSAMKSLNYSSAAYESYTMSNYAVQNISAALTYAKRGADYARWIFNQENSNVARLEASQKTAISKKYSSKVLASIADSLNQARAKATDAAANKTDAENRVVLLTQDQNECKIYVQNANDAQKAAKNAADKAMRMSNAARDSSNLNKARDSSKSAADYRDNASMYANIAMQKWLAAKDVAIRAFVHAGFIPAGPNPNVVSSSNTPIASASHFSSTKSSTSVIATVTSAVVSTTNNVKSSVISSSPATSLATTTSPSAIIATITSNVIPTTTVKIPTIITVTSTIIFTTTVNALSSTSPAATSTVTGQKGLANLVSKSLAALNLVL